jgi:hypothetical protein
LNSFGFRFQDFRVFEIVDRFSLAATGVVVMTKALTRCEESVFKLENQCIQSFDPSSSFTVLEIWWVEMLDQSRTSKLGYLAG